MLLVQGTPGAWAGQGALPEPSLLSCPAPIPWISCNWRLHQALCGIPGLAGIWGGEPRGGGRLGEEQGMAWPHIPGLPCALGAPWGSALAGGQAGTQGRWALLEKSHISHLGLWCCPPCSHLPVQRGKESGAVPPRTLLVLFFPRAAPSEHPPSNGWLCSPADHPNPKSLPVPPLPGSCSILWPIPAPLIPSLCPVLGWQLTGGARSSLLTVCSLIPNPMERSREPHTSCWGQGLSGGCHRG